MALDPNFAVKPRSEGVSFSTGNTSSTGTGTIQTLITGAADGTLVFRVRITATANTTAGMLRLFIAASGSYRLIEEINVDALTKSATVKGFHTIKTFEGTGLILEYLQSLAVSTHNAEAFTAITEAGDFTL